MPPLPLVETVDKDDKEIVLTDTTAAAAATQQRPRTTLAIQLLVKYNILLMQKLKE